MTGTAPSIFLGPLLVNTARFEGEIHRLLLVDVSPHRLSFLRVGFEDDLHLDTFVSFLVSLGHGSLPARV